MKARSVLLEQLYLLRRPNLLLFLLKMFRIILLDSFRRQPSRIDWGRIHRNASSCGIHLFLKTRRRDICLWGFLLPTCFYRSCKRCCTRNEPTSRNVWRCAIHWQSFFRYGILRNGFINRIHGKFNRRWLRDPLWRNFIRLSRVAYFSCWLW